MSKKRGFKSSNRVAIPEYRAEDWARWLETADDRRSFEAGHASWGAEASAMAERIERAGLDVAWVALDPDRTVEWCRSRGYANTRERRFQFAAEAIGNARIQ